MYGKYSHFSHHHVYYEQTNHDAPTITVQDNHWGYKRRPKGIVVLPPNPYTVPWLSDKADGTSARASAKMIRGMSEPNHRVFWFWIYRDIYAHVQGLIRAR